MTAELDSDDEMKNSRGLQELYYSCNKDHGPLTLSVDVLFKIGKKEAFNCEVPIVIAYDNMLQLIAILWEEAGYLREELKLMQLYGIYYCQYVKMTYIKTKKLLEINSCDSNKIVRVHSI